MNNVLKQIECKFNSNSMVIGVLRSAMDKAHEKLQSKDDGPIEFLHERSKFYELSAVLVEAVLNIIEEIDILENNGEKIRLDLMEIEHWLQGRVKQTKFPLVEKYRELKEKIDNELRLKQALELKERELVYLRAKLEIEDSKSENEPQIEDLNDQHVYDRDDMKGGGGGGEEAEEDDEFSGFDSERHEQSEVIQQMSSDINILIGTLDFAFGRMHKAEFLPLEKKWKWTIEKDIVSMLTRGFLKDIQQNVEEKLEGRNTSILNHSITMNEEMRNLIQERDCQSRSNLKLISEVESLGQQCDDQRMETLLLEEIYQGLLEGICSTKEDVINQECISNRSLGEKIYGTERNGSMKIKNNDVSCIYCQTLEPLNSLLKVDVCTVYLMEMARTWRVEIEAYHLENLFREEIYQFVVIEVAKDDRNRLAQNIHCSVNTYVDEDESQNSKKLEVRQEDNNNISPDLHQWGRNQYFHAKNMNATMKIACTNTLALPHMDLDWLITNIEKLVQEKLERMVDLKHQMLALPSLMVSLRKQNSVYKKAFLKRCQNLALAEAEVDLLGDEVDRIRNVLKTVYQVLDENSTALSNYIGVTDLMKLMENGLDLV